MAKRRPGSKVDPFTAGLRSYARGIPFDPEFGPKCTGWGPISAQTLYERGRLQAAAERPKPIKK